MNHNFAKGDRVVFSREFLRNTGQFTGEVPFARGIVQSVEPFGDRSLVAVQWDFLPCPRKALNVNLILAADRHKEPA